MRGGRFIRSAVGAPYGAAVRLRNFLYERGILRARKAAVPVISVGNVTVGGTGKTPIVEFIVRRLREMGESPCVISRGYGRENESELVVISDGGQLMADVRQAGDEPSELALKLLGIGPVICDSNRLRAAEFAVSNYRSTVLVLDDAFQHRKIRRDLDIVVIDAMRVFGNGHLLPAGPLREPPVSLKRADLVILTRTGLEREPGTAEREVRSIIPDTPVINCRGFASGVIDANDLSEGPSELKAAAEITDELRSKPALAFTGLGNPKGFYRSLEKDGFSLVSELRFPDHHWYTDNDLGEILNASRHSGAKMILTTVKDAVKLPPEDFGIPCYAVVQELIFEEEEVIERALRKAVSSGTQSRM